MYVVTGDTSNVIVIDRERNASLATGPITGGPEPIGGFDGRAYRLPDGSRVKRSHIYKRESWCHDSDTGKVIDAIDTEGASTKSNMNRQAIACITPYTGSWKFKQIDAITMSVWEELPPAGSPRLPCRTGMKRLLRGDSQARHSRASDFLSRRKQRSKTRRSWSTSDAVARIDRDVHS